MGHHCVSTQELEVPRRNRLGGRPPLWSDARSDSGARWPEDSFTLVPLLCVSSPPLCRSLAGPPSEGVKAYPSSCPLALAVSGSALRCASCIRSANSFPSAALCPGIHRTVIVLPWLQQTLVSSMISMTISCPGPGASLCNRVRAIWEILRG